MRTHTKFGIKIFQIDFVIEIKWYLIFWPLQRAPGGQGKNKFAVGSLVILSNSHIKFGWIWSNELGGDSITDRRMNGLTDGRWRLQNPLRFFFKKSVGITKRSLLLIYCLLHLPLFVGVLCWSLFWYALLYVLSSFANILTRKLKRELVVLLLLSFACLVTVNIRWLFLSVPWVCL